MARQRMAVIGMDYCVGLKVLDVVMDMLPRGAFPRNYIVTVNAKIQPQSNYRLQESDVVRVEWAPCLHNNPN